MRNSWAEGTKLTGKSLRHPEYHNQRRPCQYPCSQRHQSVRRAHLHWRRGRRSCPRRFQRHTQRPRARKRQSSRIDLGALEMASLRCCRRQKRTRGKTLGIIGGTGVRRRGQEDAAGSKERVCIYVWSRCPTSFVSCGLCALRCVCSS
jgi:hypothetical protein